MMKLRGWGVAGMALAAGLAVWFASRGSVDGPPAPAQDADWVSALVDMAPEGFDRLSGSWALDLPADHGLHAAARTELWQLSAHLTDEDGEPVGVQFLVFRIALVGPDAPAATSIWDVRDLFRGHVVMAGPAGVPIVAEERFGRGMEGLAGFDPTLGELRLDSWSIDFPHPAHRDRWRLTTGSGDARIDLALTPVKDPLHLDGDAAPFRGYAFSRLRAEGTVASETGRRSVSGVAWFEHLWGELPIPGATPVASDRLQVQLDDGSDLSVVRTRRVEGAGSATVDALLIDAEGGVAAFADDTAELDPMRRWQGGTASWPVDWRLRLGDLQLDITPVIDAQEHDFMLGVWSGLVRAEGTRGDRAVSGLGTLQLSANGR